MKHFLAFLTMLALGVGFVSAEEPKFPTPQKEHEWFKHLEGDWTFESECVMEPGKPPIKCKGTESVRPMGGFWTVSEMKSEMMGLTFNATMTLGFDTKKKKYVGTWVCSMCDNLCVYEGSLDKDSKVLTLETEGPHPTSGKLVKMRDVIELKDKDHRILKSYMQEGEKWIPFMTATYTRKK